MSENKQRQNTRLQNRDWEETPSRVNENARNQYNSLDEDWEDNAQSEPQLTQNRNYTNENYESNQGYFNEPLYRSQQQLEGQSRNTVIYGSQQPSYGRSRGYEPLTQNPGSNYGQSQQTEYSGPYGYQRRHYVNNPYIQNTPQYGGSFGQQQPYTPYSNNPQYPTNYIPGRWNEGNYRENPEWEASQYGQQGNYPGMKTYGPETNWNSPVTNATGIHEQGKLFSTGPHRGKGPKGYQRSDERIKEDINDRMMDDGQLDATDIEVEVDNNEVVLNGSVESRLAKRRAEDIAESISGVNNVENHLRINKGMERRSAGLSSTNTDSKNKRSSLAGSAS